MNMHASRIALRFSGFNRSPFVASWTDLKRCNLFIASTKRGYINDSPRKKGTITVDDGSWDITDVNSFRLMLPSG